MKDFWDIKEFPGYRVSSDGIVQSCRTRGGRSSPWRDMSLQVDGTGRYFVGLRRDGKIYRRQVHALVLNAFVGPCPPGMEGCHGNGDHSDNRLCNLRWDTHASNCKDRDRHGRTAQGSRNGTARLDEAKVREIRRIYAAGEADQYELAAMFKVGQSTIGRIVRRENWLHV